MKYSNSNDVEIDTVRIGAIINLNNKTAGNSIYMIWTIPRIEWIILIQYIRFSIGSTNCTMNQNWPPNNNEKDKQLLYERTPIILLN